MTAPTRAPLSTAQRGLLFETSRAGARELYRETVVLRPDQPVELTALLTAIGIIWARHPALGASVAGAVGAEDLVADHRQAVTIRPAPRDDEAAVEAAVWATRREPLDARVGPLARVTVLADGPLGWGLIIDAHHLVLDSRSCSIIAQDLHTVLRGGALPASPRSFVDSLAAGRAPAPERLHDLAAALAAGPIPPPVPDRAGAATATRREFSLDGAGAATAQSRAHDLRTTIFCLLLGGWLHCLADLAPPTLSIAIDGRGREDRSTVGHFTELLPLRVARTDPTLYAVVHQVTQSMMEAAGRLDAPLATLAPFLRRCRARPDVFTRLVANYDDVRQGEVAGVTLREWRPPAIAPRFPMSLTLRHERHRLVVRLEYDAAHYPGNRVETAFDRYQSLLPG